MSKTILSEQQEQEIVYKYTVLKISKNQLRLEYGVSEGTIRRALLRNGVQLRTIKETNISKFKINENFFDINFLTANGAYVIGLIASDGYVSSVDNGIYIELQQSDRELLEQVNQAIENERPIKDYIRANGYKNSKFYCFSAKLKKDLSYYDIVPNKTYQVVNFAKNIPDEYFFDFLRGFSDGDGSIAWATAIRWQLDGDSLPTFETIQKRIKELINIDVAITETTDSTCTVPRYRLYSYSQNKVRTIFNAMYKDDNCIKLHRKYNRFLELLK